jgi:hypothetical protein
MLLPLLAKSWSDNIHAASTVPGARDQ